jgi:hypothetical protein
LLTDEEVTLMLVEAARVSQELVRLRAEVEDRPYLMSTTQNRLPSGSSRITATAPPEAAPDCASRSADRRDNV